MKKLYKAENELSEQEVKLSISNEDLQDINKQSFLLNRELNRMSIQLKELNQSLLSPNFLREECASHFLDLCLNYIEKYDNYRKSLSSQTSRFDDDELREFYRYFDSSFLRIYPNFISKFNVLLAEKDRFELKNGDFLDTELRIFALIRLGIDDSGKIASFLRCSIRTVYDYKNRMKNKAIVPRDEFEKWVKKIES